MVDLCKTADYYTGVTGILPMLYSIRDCIPGAFSMLLVGIFFVLFTANYFFIKSKTGRVKIFTALLSSTFVTTILSIFLALSSLITYRGLLFWTFLTIVSFIVLYLSDKQ